MNVRHKESFMKSKYALFILLAVYITIISLISSGATTTNCWDAFKFIIFQIGGMLIPGLAILKLFPIKCRTREEQLLLAYVDGYILSMVMYLIVMILNLEKYVALLYLGISIISIVLIATKHKEEEPWPINEKKDIVPWIFLAVLLFVSWLVFSMHWGVSIYTTEFSDDGLFWIGDIISLEKEFLPRDFRALYSGRKYHYGGAMQLALICKVTNISAYNIAMHYSYIQSMILLSFSAYCIGKKVVKEKKAIFLMLFLLFFSTGIENQSLVTYIWHIFIQPMSFNIALSFELIIILLMLFQVDEKEINYCLMFRVVLAMLVCTITKGPSGAIAVCAAGIICIWWLIRKKEIKKSVLYGSFLVLAFGLIYLFLSSIQTFYVANDVALDNLADTEQIAWNSFSLYERLKNVILYIYRYIVYVITVNPWTFIPAGVYFVYTIVRKKTDLIHWICAIVLCIGTGLGYSLDYVGKSQMYFTLAVYPFAAVLTGLAVQEILSHESRLTKQGKGVKSFLSVVICSVILLLSAMGAHRNSFEHAVYIGIANLYQRDYHSIQGEYVYDKMEYTEYGAYEWIRQNTDEKALFLSDRMLEENIECRIPGVFSERYIYRFGTEEDIENGKKCFMGNEESVLYYADKGVRYIIQNKRISPDFVCNENIAIKIYDDQQIAVYELQDSDKWKQF